MRVRGRQRAPLGTSLSDEPPDDRTRGPSLPRLRTSSSGRSRCHKGGVRHRRRRRPAGRRRRAAGRRTAPVARPGAPQPAGRRDRQAVEQRGDVGQRGRLCRRLSRAVRRSRPPARRRADRPARRSAAVASSASTLTSWRVRRRSRSAISASIFCGALFRRGGSASPHMNRRAAGDRRQTLDATSQAGRRALAYTDELWRVRTRRRSWDSDRSRPS